MSFTTYSQDLRPDRVIVSGQDTLFCWGQPKTRVLAKKIVRLSYCDSIRQAQTEEISIQDSMITDQDTIIKALEDQKGNMLQVFTLKDTQIVKLNLAISQKDREIRKQKFLKWVGLAASGVLGTILIVK